MRLRQRTRVMIVDDHSILRVGLQQVLEQSGEFEVVGQAADGNEAVRIAAEVSPDLVVMDVMMPNKDGVAACREIIESAPDTRVIILTASTEEDAVVDAVAAGATGYVQKGTDREQFLAAVRAVAKGELRLPVDLVKRTFASIRGRVATATTDDLTARERQILTAFATGMSYAQIAEARGIKPVTVRNAIYDIQHKVNVGTMQELVLWSVRHGLLDGYVASE
ncbi:MAG: response regulator transcription factor [Chloroflexi bacterium]|nr:response regulator transcription factor [Chloroflexota bacterium]